MITLRIGVHLDKQNLSINNRLLLWLQSCRRKLHEDLRSLSQFQRQLLSSCPSQRQLLSLAPFRRQLLLIAQFQPKLLSFAPFQKGSLSLPQQVLHLQGQQLQELHQQELHQFLEV